MSFLCVFFLPGHQLLSRSGGPWSDYSRTEGAHNAANHFPPGTGSWGKVPYQVSSLKTSTLLTADFLWGGGGIRRGEGNKWRDVGKSTAEHRKAVCLLVAQKDVYVCMRSMLIQWHEKKAADWSAQPERAWLHPSLCDCKQLLKDHYLALNPPVHRCRLKLPDKLFRSKLRAGSV